jgi:dipeptidyl aminopeptidase/acylaminoacyl peptidase
MMRLDGSERKPFSAGPLDEAPTWSPDGKRLAFVAPAEGRSDLDVFVVAVAGGARQVVVDDPNADEGSPRFSADGHVLLATSKVRDGSGRLLVAMIVAADLDDAVPSWRGLVERQPVPRLGVSPAPVPLDRKMLRRAPSYEKALDRF